MTENNFRRNRRPLPPVGVNKFGFFDYDHYGTLVTPLSPENQDFTRNTRILGVECKGLSAKSGEAWNVTPGRVSIVNEFGYCLYDKFVKPPGWVPDCKTIRTGIRKEDLENGTPTAIVLEEVKTFLTSDHIVIGENLNHILHLLKIYLPKKNKRDIRKFYRSKPKIINGRDWKDAVQNHFGVDMRIDIPSSIMDAQAAVAIYLLCLKKNQVKLSSSSSSSERDEEGTPPSPPTETTQNSQVDLENQSKPVGPLPGPSSESAIDGKLRRLRLGKVNALKYFEYDRYGISTAPITRAQLLFTNSTQFLSLDSKMVDVVAGPGSATAKPYRRTLGWVSVVNEYGYCLYNKFVLPVEPITRYRTRESGIRKEDLINATPHDLVVQEVNATLNGHIVIGRNLKQIFLLLGNPFPLDNQRDLAKYLPPKLRLRWYPGLPKVAKEVLDINVKFDGERSSVKDAQTAMVLYQVHQRQWEKSLREAAKKAKRNPIRKRRDNCDLS